MLMTTTLPVQTPWYSRTRVTADITLLSEPFVHPLLRSNIWHLRGSSRDVVIDTGLGVASLVDAAPDLFNDNTLAIATHSHTDHIGNFHEFTQRAIHNAEADVVANISGTLEFDISSTDEATFDQLAGWGYDIRGGLLTAIPEPQFPLDGHPRHPAAATQLLSEATSSIWEIAPLKSYIYPVTHRAASVCGIPQPAHCSQATRCMTDDSSMRSTAATRTSTAAPCSAYDDSTSTSSTPATTTAWDKTASTTSSTPTWLTDHSNLSTPWLRSLPSPSR